MPAPPRDRRAQSDKRGRGEPGTNLALAMQRFILPGMIAVAAVALLALLAFGVSYQSDNSSIDSQVARGSFPLAPSSNMSLPMLGSSASRTLADYRGKVVVLNVFASWCVTCTSEAPVLASEQHILARHNATML